MKTPKIFDRSKIVGLLADSHGNIDSIKQAINRLREFSFHGLIHLGDIYDSIKNDNLYEIYKIISQNNFLTVKGNNDYQIEKLLNNGHSFDLPLAEKNKILSFLSCMPMRRVADGICFTHSLPFKSIRSFYEPVDTGTTQRAEQLFEQTFYKVIFCGHSHSSVLFRWRAGTVTRELITPNEVILFNSSERYIVIVGASDNGECGIFDKDQMTYQRVCFHS